MICRWEMGRGFPIVNSTKQKLDMRSSTKSEIIAADDCMPTMCWTRCFAEAQVCRVNENTVFKDNKSAILVEKNGKASSSKCTKHIDIRCCFVTDRIANGEVSVTWCPTGDMTGDFMMKPAQGALFKKLIDQAMGVMSVQDPGPGKPQNMARRGNAPEQSHHRSTLEQMADKQSAQNTCMHKHV